MESAPEAPWSPTPDGCSPEVTAALSSFAARLALPDFSLYRVGFTHSLLLGVQLLSPSVMPVSSVSAVLCVSALLFVIAGDMPPNGRAASLLSLGPAGLWGG